MAIIRIISQQFPVRLLLLISVLGLIPTLFQTGAAATDDARSASRDGTGDGDNVAKTKGALDVVPGVHEKLRKQLREQIETAGKRGVGVKAYLTAFQQLEKMVADGSSGDQVKKRILSIARGLHEQMYRKQTLKYASLRQIAPSSSASSSSSSKTGKGSSKPSKLSDGEMESIMLTLVNQSRATNGLSALGRVSALDQAAREHSKDMAARGYFSHVSPDGSNPYTRASRYGRFNRVAENISAVVRHETARSTMISSQAGLMRSPTHRANILNQAFTGVGIGVAQSKKGNVLVTQVFGN